MDFKDKQGGAWIRRLDIDLGRAILNKVRLSDIGFKGDVYTWFNGQYGHLCVRERLDHAIANGPWRLMQPNAYLEVIPMYDFDHLPILLEFHEPQDKYQETI